MHVFQGSKIAISEAGTLNVLKISRYAYKMSVFNLSCEMSEVSARSVKWYLKKHTHKRQESQASLEANQPSLHSINIAV